MTLDQDIKNIKREFEALERVVIKIKTIKKNDVNQEILVEKLRKVNQIYRNFIILVDQLKYQQEEIVSNILLRVEQEKQGLEVTKSESKTNQWYSKACSNLKDKHYKEAVKYFENAIAQNPNYEYTWNYKGYTLKEIAKNIPINQNTPKRVQEKKSLLLKAIEDFDKAIEINPRKSVFWVNKSDALWELKDYQEAVNSINKAIEINPREQDFKKSLMRIIDYDNITIE
ncbi:MAG: tetratricopeptide repeat protein [Nanoarchaeota archaeon]|nr:tetratricopeptide repeat protein [Nanoarchaeota archaeon]MBU1855086.1 tetratricopeptide repeat protein [Nanoarchaeota archaeon]